MFEAAAGSGENQRLFAALGITFRETNGDLRATDQVLRDLATRFQAMPDGPEKSALAVKLFGKAGTDMIPFLNRGAEGIQELTAQFRELGGEISGETATRAAEFNDDLNLLRAACRVSPTASPRVSCRRWATSPADWWNRRRPVAACARSSMASSGC
jgi:TP901 family phage tail tape measure protein